ncbi:MAG TPA: preprotein translocase subunit SecA, partial [Mycobacterium sp.]
PSPTVAPVAAPPGLAEFAAAAAAAQEQQGGVATKQRPAAPALRAKGIDDSEQPLTYSGPSEGGGVEVTRSGGAKPSGGGSGGGTRRERREAARQRGRHAKKG